MNNLKDLIVTLSYIGFDSSSAQFHFQCLVDNQLPMSIWCVGGRQYLSLQHNKSRIVIHHCELYLPPGMGINAWPIPSLTEVSSGDQLVLDVRVDWPIKYGVYSRQGSHRERALKFKRSRVEWVCEVGFCLEQPIPAQFSGTNSHIFFVQHQKVAISNLVRTNLPAPPPSKSKRVLIF